MKVTIPILNNEYKAVFCCGDESEVKKVLKDCYHVTDDISNDFFDNHRGLCFYDSSCHPVIAMPKFPETPDEIATLAHEASHAVNDIFRKIGETHSDEIYSHSVGAIVRKVLEKKPK